MENYFRVPRLSCILPAMSCICPAKSTCDSALARELLLLETRPGRPFSVTLLAAIDAN